MRHCLLAAALLSTAAPLAAHDLFFRPHAFHLAPGATVTIPVLNGTFSRSENAVARDRLADLALSGPGGRQALDHAAWSEDDPTSGLRLTIGGPGTYVVAAAIKPRLLELPGRDFNAYLQEEGIDHVLRQRRADGTLDAPSKERYSKHVKSVLQSGDVLSDAFGFVFGHEAEIVPLENPYVKSPGDTLALRCLVRGRPLAGYVVFAGGRRQGPGDQRLPRQRLTTDADGRVRVRLTDAGAWYVKFVHMEAVTAPDANYESLWATISFAVGHLR